MGTLQYYIIVATVYRYLYLNYTLFIGICKVRYHTVANASFPMFTSIAG